MKKVKRTTLKLFVALIVFTFFAISWEEQNAGESQNTIVMPFDPTPGVLVPPGWGLLLLL